MKKLVLISLVSLMALNLFSQKFVYSSDGSKKSFESEDMDFKFSSDKGIEIQQSKAGQESALLSSLPTFVNIAFQLTTDLLERHSKKFTAEYTKHTSFIDSTHPNIIPMVTFYRNVSFEKNTSPNDEALKIEMIPFLYKLNKQNAFIFYIDAITLNYSSAKVRPKDKTLDFIIEIKPTLLINNEKKIIEIAPITVPSVTFSSNGNHFKNMKYRSDIVILPAGAIMTELSLKIVESNPRKVRAEKVLSTWNSYKDSTKTIINNFLPKEKSGNGNTPTGNK